MDSFRFRHKDKMDTLYSANQYYDDYSMCLVSWGTGERKYPVETVNELLERKVWIKQ